MRLSTQVILLLLASLAAKSSGLRGEPNRLLRSLQQVGDAPKAKDDKEGLKGKDKMDDKGDKDDRGDKDDKGDKKGKEDKEEKSDKADKKEADKCKKAKKSKKEGSGERRRRTEETIAQDAPEDVEETIPFCSHSILSMEECANLESVRSDGMITGALRIELVHNDEKQPEDITSETEEILDGEETKSRFVGCGDLNTSPTAVRYLQGLTDDEGYEVVTREESERVGVTGVEFKDLAVSRECQNADVPSGSVCDVIQSNVEIYYQSASGEVTKDDERDMKDLLIDTIMSLAVAGSFDNLGSVESVEVTGSSQDGVSSIVPYVLAGFAAVLILGLAYWYGVFPYVLAAIAAVLIFCLPCWFGGNKRDGQDGKRENVVETSDEEHSDEEHHTVAEIPVNSAIDSQLPQATPGNLFTSNDEHPEDEVKAEKAKASEGTNSEGLSWLAGWFGPAAPVDQEC